MRYHDFHLQGYEVKDKGKSITLSLIYDYPSEEIESSCIIFTDVTLYNFTHISGAIITGIEEIDILNLVKDRWQELENWNRMYGVSHWNAEPETYSNMLISSGYRAWEITSAIGFYGFVVAKNIANT